MQQTLQITKYSCRPKYQIVYRNVSICCKFTSVYGSLVLVVVEDMLKDSSHTMKTML